MRLIQFGSLALPAFAGEDDIPLLFRQNVVDLRDGGFDLDGDQVSRRRYTVNHTAEIWDTATQTITEQVWEISRALQKGRQLLYAEDRDGVLYQTWAKGVGVTSRAWKPGDVGKQKVDIEFEITWPFWLLSADEPWFFDSGESFDTGLFFDSHADQKAITAVPDTITIDNTGAAPALRGFTWFRPRAGASITNPKITNGANGYWFRYNGTLVADDLFYIDWLAKAVRLNFADAWADFELGPDQTDFMILELDSNVLTIEADAISGTVDVIVNWSRHYG